MQREISELEEAAGRAIEVETRYVIWAVLAVAAQLESLRGDLKRTNDLLQTIAEGQ